uniref:Uncharacterized protein n=1 Tax=viral metagenome TaxID=1070528 RepID=A0A6H2A3D0_9ZZZZ
MERQSEFNVLPKNNRGPQVLPGTLTRCPMFGQMKDPQDLCECVIFDKGKIKSKEKKL